MIKSIEIEIGHFGTLEKYVIDLCVRVRAHKRRITNTRIVHLPFINRYCFFEVGAPKANWLDWTFYGVDFVHLKMNGKTNYLSLIDLV